MLGLTWTIIQLSVLFQSCGATWLKYCLLHNVTENIAKKAQEQEKIIENENRKRAEKYTNKKG